MFLANLCSGYCANIPAASIKRAKRSKIAKILIPGSYGKQTDASVDRILKAAQVSVGTSSATKEIILKQKASLLIQLEQHLQELTDILIELCEEKDKRRYRYSYLYERNWKEDCDEFSD